MAILIDDIKDEKSLEAWLNERPEAVRQNCAVFIAARVALRSMTSSAIDFQFSDWSAKSDLTAIPMLRSLFISSVAAKLPTDDVRKAARATRAAAAAVISYAVTVYAVKAVTDTTDAAVTATTDAASDATNDATNAATAWTVVRADCQLWLDHAAPDGTCGIDVAPLDLEALRHHTVWRNVREKLLNDSDPDRGADWSFWVDWYDKILCGDPQDWDMLHEIAVSDDIDWEASPREVNEAIARIVEKHQPQHSERADPAEKKLAEQLLHAAISDFEFDQVSRLMRAVPFADDIKTITDPETLDKFLDDAETLRDDIELFCAALAAEGNAIQGAGTVRTYFSAILEEFSKARQTETLRIGRIVDLGAVVHSASVDERTRLEFGPFLCAALDANVGRLTNLVRDYFAPTLLRFAPLRELELEAGTNAWEYLNEIKAVLGGITQGNYPDLVGLAPEDLAVLNDLAFEVEVKLRAVSNSDGEVQKSLRRELNYRFALLNVSIALYGLRAKDPSKSLRQLLDNIAFGLKSYKSLNELWNIIKGWYENTVR